MRKKTLLIAYDIASPARLGRVHRRLKKVAIPVQYSIFITRLDPRKLKQLIMELKMLIDAKEDDVRIYELPEQFEVKLLGRQQLPEGITLQLGGLERMLQQP